VEVIMYQAGYLTITEVIKNEDKKERYRLYFPNKEVKESFLDYLILYFT